MGGRAPKIWSRTKESERGWGGEWVTVLGLGAWTLGFEGGGAGSLDPWVQGRRSWEPGPLGLREKGLGAWTAGSEGRGGGGQDSCDPGRDETGTPRQLEKGRSCVADASVPKALDVPFERETKTWWVGWEEGSEHLKAHSTPFPQPSPLISGSILGCASCRNLLLCSPPHYPIPNEEPAPGPILWPQLHPHTHTGRPSHPAPEPGPGRSPSGEQMVGDSDPRIRDGQRLQRDAGGGGRRNLRTWVLTSFLVTEGEERFRYGERGSPQVKPEARTPGPEGEGWEWESRSWSLVLGRTEPSEVWGEGVGCGGLGPQGSKEPPSPASSGCPRRSQEHPRLSPALFSAKMPGPGKPAGPVGHSCEPPPPPPCFPLPWLQGGLSPAPRVVSRWAEGRLKRENRTPQSLLHHPCSRLPPAPLIPAPSTLRLPESKG